MTGWLPTIQVSGQLISAFAAISALIISLISYRRNIETLLEMKTIDLMRSFQDRYDKMRWDMATAVKTPQEAEHYYARFWNLQLEQYEYWRRHLIKDEIFEYWMNVRRYESQNNGSNLLPNVVGYSFADGWKNAQTLLTLHRHFDGDFVQFINNILSSDYRVIDIIRSHRRCLPNSRRN